MTVALQASEMKSQLVMKDRISLDNLIIVALTLD